MQLTFGASRHTSLFYRLFLFLLICDAWGKGCFLYFPVRVELFFHAPAVDSPCSIHAANLIVKHAVSLNVERQQKMLLSFFVTDKGFSTFHHLKEPDLLSTAAALFALKTTEADIWIVAPACLELIQNNYLTGAFLAGNSGEVRDLEYTFYGLLSLGPLVRDNHEFLNT